MAPDKLAKAYLNRNNTLPLKEREETIMVKISAPDDKKGKEQLDIVFVLDVSGSMKGAKMESMKKAMFYLIDKLGVSDRIAIVTFDAQAHKKHERLTDLGNKDEAKDIVTKMRAGGGTHIEKGLRAGIELLDSRRDKRKPASCIFLMTDGEENNGSKAMNLIDLVETHTIHTFGFGQKSNETLLFDIASRSHVGIYHHVPDTGVEKDLQDAFASSLAIFRTICMMGLKVTLKPTGGCKIKEVHPCGYKKAESQGSWTIAFGDVARQENRRILVDLWFPKVSKNQKDQHVLDVIYEYSPPKKNPEKNTLPVLISRDQNANENAPADEQVTRERVRREQAKRLREALTQANDKKNLTEAKRQVGRARSELDLLKKRVTDDVTESLENELDNLDNFLESEDAYNKLGGRAYLLACISSHDRQRYATRGGEYPVHFYLTDRMKKYLAGSSLARSTSFTL